MPTVAACVASRWRKPRAPPPCWRSSACWASWPNCRVRHRFCRNRPILVVWAETDDGMKMMSKALRKVIKRMHYPLEVMLNLCALVRDLPAEPAPHRGDDARDARSALITPPSIAGRSRSCRSWPRCSAGANARQAQAGGWRRPTSKSAASGSTCPGQSTATATRSIFCFVLTETVLRHGDSSNEPSNCIARPRRSPSIDKSGANTAAIEGMCADSGADIELRQSKYLNNIVERDHRVIKHIVRPGNRPTKFPGRADG